MKKEVAILLLGLSFFFSIGTGIANAGRIESSRGKDPELQKIDEALERARSNKRAAQRLVKGIAELAEHTKRDAFANRLGVAARSSGGISIALPDVCKTPSPAGPIPIPYPNIGGASDRAKGTKKVKLGGKAVLLENPDFASAASTGEENSSRLLGHLEAIRSQLARKARFVADLCEECRLKKKDRKWLDRSLADTRKEVEQQLSLFDRHVSDIELIRKAYLKFRKRQR